MTGVQTCALPILDIRIQEVSGHSGKGLHTTTFAEMYDLPGGGKVIDTPGMREFGLVDITRQELSHYFPEMRQLLQGCQFNNCVHINEPGCMIKEAVADGRIHEDRYVSYYNILESYYDMFLLQLFLISTHHDLDQNTSKKMPAFLLKNLLQKHLL